MNQEKQNMFTVVSQRMDSRIADQKRHCDTVVEREKAYTDGYAQGARDALAELDAVNRANAKKTASADEAYTQGVNDMLYELGKELGIGCGNLREMAMTLDMKAAAMADFIRDHFVIDKEGER